MGEAKKGKTGKVVGGVGIVGLLGAATAYLLTHCGAGFGFGGGGTGSSSAADSGAGDTSSAVVQEADTTASSAPDTTALTTESTAATVKAVGVTVNGNDYFYENHSYALADLMDTLKKLDAGTAVRITDENASLNAYNALITELQKAEISYIEAAAS